MIDPTKLVVSAVLREPVTKGGSCRLVVYSRGTEVGTLKVDARDAEEIRERLLADRAHSRCGHCGDWVADEHAAHGPDGVLCRRCVRDLLRDG